MQVLRLHGSVFVRLRKVSLPKVPEFRWDVPAIERYVRYFFLTVISFPNRRYILMWGTGSVPRHERKLNSATPPTGAPVGSCCVALANVPRLHAGLLSDEGDSFVGHCVSLRLVSVRHTLNQNLILQFSEFRPFLPFFFLSMGSKNR